VIELPEGVVPRSATPRYIDFGGNIRPPTGGRSQRVDRLGNRFAMRFVLPVLRSKDKGRRVVSRLIEAKSAGIRVRLPTNGFDPGLPGAPVVDGNSQAGTSLAIRGLTPAYAAREGQWLNHHRGDDVLLYNVRAQAIADGAGDAVLTLAPLLRVEPVDGDIINLARPVIQGSIVGEDWEWEWAVDRLTSIEFIVEEDV
jgi:hypothetical protein